MKDIEEGVALAALSLAVLETMKIYADTAPGLKELRCAPPGDFMSRQLILDADMMGLIVVVALGGGGALLMKRWYPLLLGAAALLLISGWYRMVLRSARPGDLATDEGE